MKEFISEYGLTILECVGGSIIIGILYYMFFGDIFSGIFVGLLNSIIGG